MDQTRVHLANPGGGFYDTSTWIDRGVAKQWIADGKAKAADAPKAGKSAASVKPSVAKPKLTAKSQTEGKD